MGIATAIAKRSGRIAELIIAASNSSTIMKRYADFVCNGISDAVDISALISSKLPSGGKVLFLAGQYNLNQRLYIRGINNLTFEGMGKATIFKLNNAVSNTLSAGVSANATQITVTSASGFAVGQDIFIGTGGNYDGVTWRQVGVTPTAPYWEQQRYVGPIGESNIITAINGNTLTLYYALTNSYTSGAAVFTIPDCMYFDACNFLAVKNIALDGNRANQIWMGGDIFLNGMRFCACNDIEVSGNYVHDVFWNFIMTHPSAGNRANIHHNIVTTDTTPADTQNQNRGIVIEGGDGNIVSNNYVRGCETNFYCVLSSGGSCQIIGNKSLTPAAGGNGIHSASSLNAQILIQGNVFTGDNVTNAKGMEISDCNSLQITGNRFINIASYSIYLAGTANNAKISDNYFYGGGQQGQVLYILTARCSIQNNTLQLFDRNGIYLYGATYCYVAGNSLIDGGQHGTNYYKGIFLDNTSTNNTIENNICNKSATIILATCVQLSDNSVNNIVKNNTAPIGSATACVVPGAGAGNIFRGNSRFNPIGLITVAVPATTVATAVQLYDCDYYITNGNASATFAIGASVVLTLGAGGLGQVTVPAGQTFTWTGAGTAPTWVVYAN